MLSGGNGTVTFKYEPFGRRIYKSSSSGTSVFAYDGDNLVEETNSSGTAVARYSQGLNIDEPLAMLRSSTTSFYQADGLGSITSLTNTSGSIAQSYTFDSFGNQTASSGSLTNPFQYTARENDPETGLYYYRARYYDPSAGRFLTEDPLNFLSDDIDFYAYAVANPLSYIDPSGEKLLIWGRTGQTLQDDLDFISALNYLRGDPGMAKIIDAVEQSDEVYEVQFTGGRNYFFPNDDGGGTILWNPRSALVLGEGCTQSPALQLGHEMAHAAGGAWARFLMKLSIFAGNYDNQEEKRVITGPEKDAAKSLCECPRSDHHDHPRKTVPSPTSR